MKPTTLNLIRVSRILVSLSDDAQALYAAIADAARAQGSNTLAHVNRDTLIAEAGLSLSDYKRSANELETAGLLERRMAWSDPECRHRNEYRLIIPGQKSRIQILAEKLTAFAELCNKLRSDAQVESLTTNNQ